MGAPKTPVMQQHAQAKRAYPDAIVFFRLGDFYEMFGDDAVACARLLDLTLTSRNKGKPDEVPMAGVPHHAAHGYIAKLLELGHKVAICEQMADPAKVKGIVPRQVVRVITPGLVTDGNQLQAARNNYLCAIDIGRDAVGVALCDLSTGELHAASAPDLARLFAELSRATPREILVGMDGDSPPAELEAAAAAVQHAATRAAVRADGALLPGDIPVLLGSLASEARHLPAAALRATARALRFARTCNPGVELPLRRIAAWDPSAALVLDETAVSHLELVDSTSGAKNATLLGVIDQTCSAAGARLLRRRLLAPLSEVERIRRRLDQVELFVVHARLRGELRRALSGVTDLERLAVRASLGEATPRDLGALRDGLQAANDAIRLLEDVEDPSDRESLGLAGTPVDGAADLLAELGRALVERPPAQLKEGSIFQPGYAPDLDELELLKKSGAERMVALETELRERTGIGTLKIRYTRVFGWYIEVSRAGRQGPGRVPAQADGRNRRALHDRRARRSRRPHHHGRGATPRARARALPGPDRAVQDGNGAHPRPQPSHRTLGRRGGPRRSRAPLRLHPARRSTTRSASKSRTAAIRWSSASRQRGASSRTTSRSTPNANDCGSSPVPTWPARARCYARSR